MLFAGIVSIMMFMIPAAILVAIGETIQEQYHWYKFRKKLRSVRPRGHYEYKKV